MLNRSKYKTYMIIGIALSFFLFDSVSCEYAFAGSRDRRSRRKSSSSGKKVKYVKSKYALKAMIALSKTRGKMDKQYKEETQNYENVRNAIEGGYLDKGALAQDVQKKFGDPVVILAEDGGALSRWVYKPGTVSFFDGQKIYLFFNAEDELLEWEDLHPVGAQVGVH